MPTQPTQVVQGNSVTLVSYFFTRGGGPPADVTDIRLVVASTDGSTTVVDTTSGIFHPSTGIYTYRWSVGQSLEPGDYLATWTGTDDESEEAQAVEVVTVLSRLNDYSSGGGSGWGTTTVGRLVLRETFLASEAGGDARSMSLAGQESAPPLTRSEATARHDDLVSLAPGTLVPVTMTDKPERNGYYTVSSVNSDLTEYRGELAKADWKLSLARIGSEIDTDIESRLIGIRRANDFSLTGESWHAPAIGHYSYYTGSSHPLPITRVSDDGSMTIYRSLPANVSPRWGCDPRDYGGGRVRLLSDGVERSGVDVAVDEDTWSLSNALVRCNAAPAGSGTFVVSSFDGDSWEDKYWNVAVGASGSLVSWNSVTVPRNDYEQIVIRLVGDRTPGRVSLDMTLRRGSRFIEGYLQSDASTTLYVYPNVFENNTTPAGSGYIVAANDDAGGNKYTIGSARSFTNVQGGVSKSSTVALDFYIGAVVNGSAAVSGDTATDLRDQYIGALPEMTVGVRR